MEGRALQAPRSSQRSLTMEDEESVSEGQGVQVELPQSLPD